MADFEVRLNLKAALDELEVDGFTISRRYLINIGEAAKVFARAKTRQVLRFDTPNEERRNPDVPHYIDGFTARTERTGRAVILHFGNRHPAANIIELGQAEHDIPPSDGGQLAWPASRDKQSGYELDRIFAPGFAVHHPAVAGYHILGSSLRSAAQKQRRIARIG